MSNKILYFAERFFYFAERFFIFFIYKNLNIQKCASAYADWPRQCSWVRRNRGQIFQEICRIVLGFQWVYSQASRWPGSAPKWGSLNSKFKLIPRSQSHVSLGYRTHDCPIIKGVEALEKTTILRTMEKGTRSFLSQSFGSVYVANIQPCKG